MKMTQKIKESSEKQKVENFEKIDSILKTKMAQKIIEKRKSMNRKPMERNFKTWSVETRRVQKRRDDQEGRNEMKSEMENDVKKFRRGVLPTRKMSAAYCSQRVPSLLGTLRDHGRIRG